MKHFEKADCRMTLKGFIFSNKTAIPGWLNITPPAAALAGAGREIQGSVVSELLSSRS